jgi:hypothetical protein
VPELVGANCRDLLEQLAHMPGIACHEHPTHVVGLAHGVASGGKALTPSRVAHVPDGEKGNGGTNGVQQVALTELCEGQVDNPLQHVIKVVSRGRSEPSCQARVGAVRWDVHVDLTTPMPKLMVQMALVRRGPSEAETVQHVL